MDPKISSAGFSKDRRGSFRRGGHRSHPGMIYTRMVQGRGLSWGANITGEAKVDTADADWSRKTVTPKTCNAQYGPSISVV